MKPCEVIQLIYPPYENDEINKDSIGTSNEEKKNNAKNTQDKNIQDKDNKDKIECEGHNLFIPRKAEIKTEEYYGNRLDTKDDNIDEYGQSKNTILIYNSIDINRMHDYGDIMENNVETIKDMRICWEWYLQGLNHKYDTYRKKLINTARKIDCDDINTTNSGSVLNRMWKRYKKRKNDIFLKSKEYEQMTAMLDSDYNSEIHSENENDNINQESQNGTIDNPTNARDTLVRYQLNVWRRYRFGLLFRCLVLLFIFSFGYHAYIIVIILFTLHAHGVMDPITSFLSSLLNFEGRLSLDQMIPNLRQRFRQVNNPVQTAVNTRIENESNEHENGETEQEKAEAIEQEKCKPSELEKGDPSEHENGEKEQEKNEIEQEKNKKEQENGEFKNNNIIELSNHVTERNANDNSLNSDNTHESILNNRIENTMQKINPIQENIPIRRRFNYYKKFIYQLFVVYIMSCLPWWGPDTRLLDDDEEILNESNRS